MKPLGFPLLADENIAPYVVEALAGQGKDIRSIHDEALTGGTDLAILRRARELGRVVLTHDSDFGRLAVDRGEDFVGIVYLRPGHLSVAFVLESVAAIEALDEEVSPPFIIVADRRGDVVRIRIRRFRAP
jgi:predicted nuclease of predicted toxin-antitoxin system